MTNYSLEDEYHLVASKKISALAIIDYICESKGTVLTEIPFGRNEPQRKAYITTQYLLI